MFGVTEFTNAE